MSITYDFLFPPTFCFLLDRRTPTYHAVPTGVYRLLATSAAVVVVELVALIVGARYCFRKLRCTEDAAPQDDYGRMNILRHLVRDSLLVGIRSSPSVHPFIGTQK
jgi:hypothetical protein